MDRYAWAIVTGLLLVSSGATFAGDERPVPILQAPFHLPVFREIRNIGSTRVELVEFELK